ncbi:MAG: hypothetical protein KME21_28950 [Desmonostoc vinosum HA7617-LM4]|jgi:hypothetical protein|nr:hypothetical protein [Desmonostoc vinosum HA7617-LM4]
MRYKVTNIRAEESKQPAPERERVANQSLQIELTIPNHNNQQPPGLAAGSLKLVMVKPPRDDSDDPPRLKTGGENFNLCTTKAIVDISTAISNDPTTTS